jgi:hypothetical protein
MSNARNGRTTFPLREKRREEAAERQAAYDKLPLAEKVARAGQKQLRKFVAAGGEGAELAQARLEGENAA